MATASKKAGAEKSTPTKSKKSEGTPLTAKNISRLAELGIQATTEEEARPKLERIFKDANLDDMGDDSISDLIEMAEAFPASAETEVEVEVESEEEAPSPKSKKAKKGKAEEAPEEEEEVVEEVEEEEVVEEEPDVEEEEEEVVEEEAPAPKSKKLAKKPSTKEAEKDADDLVEEVEEKDLKVPKVRKAPPAADGKKAKKKTTRVRKLLGKHWEDLSLAEKEKAVKPLRKILPEKEFRFDFLTRSFVVKYLGKSSEHNIFKYHLLRLLENGKLEGVLISHRFKTAEELQGYLPEELGGALLKTGVSCSYIQPFSQDSLTELLTDTDFLKDSIAIATKQDNKMKANMDKLREQLDGDGKKTTKKPAAKAAPKKEEPKAPAKKIVAKAVPVKKAVVAPAKKTPEKKVVAPAKKAVAKKK